MNQCSHVPRLKEQNRDLASKVNKDDLLCGNLFDNHTFTKWKIEELTVDEIVNKLTGTMGQPSTLKSGDIPAGYTYLGQLITHDIVRPIEGDSRDNYSPYLDLGCIYPTLEQFDSKTADDYERMIDLSGRFIVGFADGGSKGDDTDLFRLEESGKFTKADIPESRNDENVLISQMHLLLQALHNKFVDLLTIDEQRKGEGNDKGRDYYYFPAKACVTLIFQRIVLDDYLKHLIQPEIYLSVVHDRARYLAPYYEIDGRMPSIPKEFSHAAFRMGHAMIKDRYHLNDPRKNPSSKREFKDVPIGKLFRQCEGSQIVQEHLVDWSLFFHLEGENTAKNFASKMGLRMSKDLLAVPTGGIAPTLTSSLQSIGSSIMKFAGIAQHDENHPNEIPPPALQVSDSSHFLSAFKNLIKADLRSSEQVPTATELLHIINSKYVKQEGSEGSYVRNLLRLNFSLNNIVFAKTMKAVSLQETVELKGIEIQKYDDATNRWEPALLEVDNAPLWLYFLNEADRLPLDSEPRSKKDPSGTEAKRGIGLGPLASLIVAEVLMMSIEGAKINVFEAWEKQEKHLGGLASEYLKFKHQYRGSRFINITEFINN